jgi:hypothetical protein
VLNDASDSCEWYPMYMRVHRHLANIKHSDNAMIFTLSLTAQPLLLRGRLQKRSHCESQIMDFRFDAIGLTTETRL